MSKVPDIELIDFIKQESSFDDKKYIIAYMYNEVLIGLIEGGNIKFPNNKTVNKDYLKEMRVFSEKGELYIWRTKNEFYYRVKTDNAEDNIHEESHYIWGTKKNDYTLEEEGRGIKITLPFKLNKDELKYKVKNYYRCNEDDGMYEFYDARLCGLEGV